MAKVKVKLNGAGVRELLQSEAMRGIITDKTDDVSERATSDSGYFYYSDVRTGRNRITGRVKPGDPRAYYANLKHNILLKALNGGVSDD